MYSQVSLFVFICKTNPSFFTADLLFFTVIARLANGKSWQFAYRRRHFEPQAKNLTATVILSAAKNPIQPSF
ncbi:MAG: hypothetical protein J6M05_03180 [Cardiobacteriaceae bacterium]|nr:hypothetical protein [Cardiobacteriaceae bacterium]